jgi:hypothetical protein
MSARTSERASKHQRERERVGERVITNLINRLHCTFKKPDVRFVIHESVGSSVESFYQERYRACARYDGELHMCKCNASVCSVGVPVVMASQPRVSCTTRPMTRAASDSCSNRH